MQSFKYHNIADKIISSQHNNCLSYNSNSKMFHNVCLSHTKLHCKQLKICTQNEEVIGYNNFYVNFSEHGNYFVFGNLTRVVQLWNADKVLYSKSEQTPTICLFDEYVPCLSLSFDASRILAGCKRKVVVYDTQT